MGRRPSDNRAAANATAAAATVALVWASSLAGCSFLFSEGPPTDLPVRATFTCGDSYAPPVVDTVVTGLLGLDALAQVATKNATVASSHDPETTRHDANVAIGVTAAFTAITAAAAVYGYSSASGCRAAREERDLALARARLLPSPYGLPPFGVPPPMWPPPPPPVSSSLSP